MEQLLKGRVVTTRTVQNAVTRMIGQSHGDIAASLAHKQLGMVDMNAALAVDIHGTVILLNNQGGQDFDPSYPPSNVPWGEPLEWYVPDDYSPLPSVLLGQTNATPPDLEHDTWGTFGGNGSGKLITVWDATKFVMDVAGRLTARVQQKLDAVPGYRGFVAKEIAPKVIARAASVAVGTVFSNVLKGRNKITGPRYISTRNWKTNQWSGVRCGFGAWYKLRGRPLLPLDEAIRRAKERQAKRRKRGPRLEKHKLPKIYQPKGHRPTHYQYEQMKAQGQFGVSRIVDNKRGYVWDEGWQEWLREILKGKAEDLAQDFGKDAAKWISRKYIQPFFVWLRKGAEDVEPKGAQGAELNVPTVKM